MSASGSRVKNNNQITFTFTVDGNDASLAVSPNAVSGFGYAEGDGPVDPIPVPAGKPFGLTVQKSMLNEARPVSVRKVDFDAMRGADSVPAILEALGLPGDSGKFNGNAVLLRRETYERIHDILRELRPDNAASLMFALAHTGIHTTSRADVPEDEVWLLEGWEK